MGQQNVSENFKFFQWVLGMFMQIHYSNPCIRGDSSITHMTSVKLLQGINMPAVRRRI